MKTFSINGAAELLERDRRTLIRALRNVPADAHENKSPRWRLRTIIDALEATDGRKGHHSETVHPLADELVRLYARFDAEIAQVKCEPSLAKRREMAIKLKPLIAQTHRSQIALGVAAGENEELTRFRADQIFLLTLRGFEGPCQWSHEQAHEYLGGTDDAES